MIKNIELERIWRRRSYHKHKDDINQKQRMNYEINRDFILERNRKYRMEHLEKYRAYDKKSRLKRVEKKRITDKKYYGKNKNLCSSRSKEYYQQNKEQIKNNTKKYREANREYYLKMCKEYYYNHKKKIRLIQSLNHKLRLKEDKSYHLMCLLRKRIWDALNTYKSGGKRKANILYGIDTNLIAKKLLNELPKDFEFGKYHVDHIIPIACFDLNDPEQLKECFKPENHQWLLAQDNLNKSDKILEEHLPLYNKIKQRLNIKEVN